MRPPRIELEGKPAKIDVLNQFLMLLDVLPRLDFEVKTADLFYVLFCCLVVLFNISGTMKGNKLMLRSFRGRSEF